MKECRLENKFRNSSKIWWLQTYCRSNRLSSRRRKM